jgi:hypothetical protein
MDLSRIDSQISLHYVTLLRARHLKQDEKILIIFYIRENNTPKANVFYCRHCISVAVAVLRLKCFPFACTD